MMPLFSLLHELAIWRRAWRTPVLWWRDDDCREPGWRLERLLAVRQGIPLTLAVIPDVDLAPLGRALSQADGVSIAQHGVDHENRLPPGGPRSEFLPGQDQACIDAAVAAGCTRLAAAGLSPRLFVPPWNEPGDRQIEAVKAAGYVAYSAGIHGAPRDGLRHIGAQVDILRWKDEPRFRGRGRIFTALRKQLEQRRGAGLFEQPIGMLTHHLVHDEPAWAFLEWFVPFSKRHFSWKGLGEILGAEDAAHDVISIRSGVRAKC